MIVQRHAVVDVALRCYPQWWRERYGDEMRAAVEDLIADGRSESLIALGLLRDAVRSRMRVAGMPRTYGLMAMKTRTSIAAATIPWLVIVPFITLVTGGVKFHSSLGHVQTGYPFALERFRMAVPVRTVAHPLRLVYPPLSRATTMIGLSSQCMGLIFVLSFLVLAVGWTSLRDGVWEMKGYNRRRDYVLSWLPFVTVILAGLCKGLQEFLFRTTNARETLNGVLVPLNGHPAIAALTGDLAWMIAIVGWVLSAVALVVVARNVELPPATLRFGRTTSVLTAIALVMSCIVFVVWCVGINLQRRVPFSAGTITATYPHSGLWLPAALAFALATIVSVCGATSARRSWRVIRAQRLWDN